MAKTPAIGHTACPVCPKIAEVKLDKAGRAYIFCPDCNIQLFTRYEHQSKFLLAKMRPVVEDRGIPVADIPALEAALLPKKETISESDPPPKKRAFSLEDL